jgi:FKBP-type peptidyl-prolyl cis-trans isomerase FkpA
MKSISPPARSFSRPAIAWCLVALVSIALNLGLLARRGRGEAPAAADRPRPAAVPRELAPYRALGSFVAENNRIPDLGWTEAQFDAFVQGERASFEGRGVPLDEDAKRLRDDVGRRVQAMFAADQPDPLTEYFRALREQEGAAQTASGLHYRIVESGSGTAPGLDDMVMLSFGASLPDGTSLPAIGRARLRVRVRDLLPGLAEGVQLLHAGGRAVLYLPPELAFDADHRPPEVPPRTPVVVRLELHAVERTTSPAR